MNNYTDNETRFLQLTGQLSNEDRFNNLVNGPAPITNTPKEQDPYIQSIYKGLGDLSVLGKPAAHILTVTQLDRHGAIWTTMGILICLWVISGTTGAMVPRTIQSSTKMTVRPTTISLIKPALPAWPGRNHTQFRC